MANRGSHQSNPVSAPMTVIGSGTVLSAIARADSALEISKICNGLGFCGCFWQAWEAEEIITWDAMPSGFLEHYYGIQADRYCPVAVAIRRKWQSFTFAEARRVLSGSPYVTETEKVWLAFGAYDGAVIFGGRGANSSALILTSDRPLEATFLQYRMELQVAAIRLDELLRGQSGLTRIKRVFTKLSDKQLEVLRLQIDHPELTVSEKSRLLGISPRMLDKRHQQITKRFGVRSFTAAVAKAVAEGTGLN